MTIGIVIADDQALVRAGFRMILEAEPDLRVLSEAKDGAEAVEDARRTRPDIVLMDIRMPKIDGLEATRRIIAATDHPPRVLMLTTFDLDEYVFDALHAGASGFLLKDVPPEQLVAGIRTVAEGESLLAPSVTRRLIESFVRDHPRAAHPPPELKELTARELESKPSCSHMKRASCGPARSRRPPLRGCTRLPGRPGARRPQDRPIQAQSMGSAVPGR
jgi:DNA-binding NarL/FixJ family response regulator